MILEGINQFCFAGLRSYDDMGMVITEPPVFSVPERDIEYISIPGRSGDLLRDNGRWKNITASYKVAALCEDFPIQQAMKQIQTWLAGSIGYSVLSDTYDPQYYRLAAPDGKISFEEKMRQIGTATLKFNCKPYKYRIDGRQMITLSSAGTVYNPESLSSVPYIRITGNGDVVFMLNNASFGLDNIDGYIELDSELMAVYKGTILQNEKALFTEFPMLNPGENNLGWEGSVTKIEIIPRWCAL